MFYRKYSITSDSSRIIYGRRTTQVKDAKGIWWNLGFQLDNNMLTNLKIIIVNLPLEKRMSQLSEFSVWCMAYHIWT
jgi:hypothetical protein